MEGSREMLYYTEEETIPEDYKKKGNKARWPELKNFFWNPYYREFVGRDRDSWGRIVLFYAVFYFCVLFFFGACLGMFSLTLDEITPVVREGAPPLQFMPGLAYRPVPDFQSPLIRFIQGQPATYKPYTDHIQTFLDQYENEKQVGENFIDCERGRDPENIDKVCRFNVDQLGGSCTWQKDYGYDEGQPCVIIKLNRIYAWMPDHYETKEELPPEASDDMRERFDSDFLGVECFGRYDADQENIGNVTYFPPPGLSRFFYPYLNQEGYRSPIMMIRFDNPINGVVINVICKIFAKNIKHHANDQAGVATFSILVD